MSADPPRLTARPFPPYAFLPGRDPHPTRDPRGHSWSPVEEPPPPYVEPARWRENDAYLYGVDLYNHGYLWEAHEAWEGAWIASRDDELQRETLQGLIQCAAAALKLRLTEPRGFAKLSQAGLGRLERVAREAPTPWLGLDVAAFALEFRAFAATQPTDADDRPRLELSPD